MEQCDMPTLVSWFIFFVRAASVESVLYCVSAPVVASMLGTANGVRKFSGHLFKAKCDIVT